MSRIIPVDEYNALPNKIRALKRLITNFKKPVGASNTDLLDFEARISDLEAAASAFQTQSSLSTSSNSYAGFNL